MAKQLDIEKVTDISQTIPMGEFSGVLTCFYSSFHYQSSGTVGVTLQLFKTYLHLDFGCKMIRDVDNVRILLPKLTIFYYYFFHFFLSLSSKYLLGYFSQDTTLKSKSSASRNDGSLASQLLNFKEVF